MSLQYDIGKYSDEVRIFVEKDRRRARYAQVGDWEVIRRRRRSADLADPDGMVFSFLIMLVVPIGVVCVLLGPLSPTLTTVGLVIIVAASVPVVAGMMVRPSQGVTAEARIVVFNRTSFLILHWSMGGAWWVEDSSCYNGMAPSATAVTHYRRWLEQDVAADPLQAEIAAHVFADLAEDLLRDVSPVDVLRLYAVGRK